MPFKIESAGLTDVGRKRGHNEDSFEIESNHDLYIVADGMGGHASGEVASKMAVDTLLRFFRETQADQNRTWPYKMDRAFSYEENRLIIGIKLANRQIFRHAQSELNLKGMGTTIVSLLVRDKHAYIGHVGDSRVYRFRKEEIRQITEDHSLLNDYMKIKKLTPQEIENFPHKNVIVRALGMKNLVQVDLAKEELLAGDIFLLCSDGLSGLISDSLMSEILRDHRNDLQTACKKLIESANKNGGNDNITVVLVKVVEV